MNKIYKIVWNAAQEAWVAVSELAKGHVKASSSGKNAKQSTVVEEEGSTSFTLYSLGKAAANAMVIGGVAVTLFSLSQTAQAADKHETAVVAQQGTREKAQGQEPNALLALGNDTYAGGRSTVVIGESSRLNGTVAMALGNGINIDHGIAPQSVFLGKSIDDRYNQDKPRGKKQSQYVKSQVIGSDIYFGGLTNNKVDGLNQATLMGNNIKHLSEEQSNSMMTASNFVFRGIKAQDSAVNGHGITVNLNSSAKRAVLNRSSITGTKININSTGDINEMLVSGTTISVTRQNNALGGALVGNNINFDSTGAAVNTEKVNYVGQDINVTASSTSNPLFGQGIALHNSNLSGAPTFGQNIKSSNSAISNTLTQGYNTTFNGATVNDSVLTVNNATITGRLTNATLMGRDINTSGNVADTQVVGNRNTVTASNTQVLGSGITANVNNSVYLGDGSEVEAKGVGEKVAINIKTEGRTAGTSDYLEQLIHDGTRAKFAGGSGVSGAVTVGNATNTRRIQHVAPGYYDANSTDAVNGSQLYAVGQSAGNAYFKAVEAAKAAKAADDKAVAAQARADAAHTLATTANTTANNALNKANAADAKAVSAQADATKAKSDAAAAKNDAGQALTKAGEAKTAAAAADTKAGQALTKAGEAKTAAAAADTKAGQALTKAGEAAQAAAAADTKAGEAKTAAAAADTKAGEAKDAAKAADDKAVAAKGRADDAYNLASQADTKADGAVAKAEAADAKAVAADAKAVAADTKAGKAAEAAQAADAKAVAADTKAGKAAEAAQAADAKAVAADTKAGKAATDAANALTTANGIDGKVSKALQAVDKGWTLQTEPGTETTINAANNVVRFKAGDNIKISQTGGNITVALTNDINVTKVTAGTVVAGNLTAKNATLGGAGHTVKVENGTNVDMGGNQIHNVGDGVKDSDAATVGQLNRALDQVAGSPAKINELNNRVDKMNKEMRGYAANAMAVTALPQVYTAGDSMISAAVGSQGGAASVAVGYSRASDNGKVVIKLNMAASSSGEKGVAAGVGYKW